MVCWLKEKKNTIGERRDEANLNELFLLVVSKAKYICSSQHNILSYFLGSLVNLIKNLKQMHIS